MPLAFSIAGRASPGQLVVAAASADSKRPDELAPSEQRVTPTQGAHILTQLVAAYWGFVGFLIASSGSPESPTLYYVRKSAIGSDLR
jgi:hypothetical protein